MSCEQDEYCTITNTTSGEAHGPQSRRDVCPCLYYAYLPAIDG